MSLVGPPLLNERCTSLLTALGNDLYCVEWDVKLCYTYIWSRSWS